MVTKSLAEVVAIANVIIIVRSIVGDGAGDDATDNASFMMMTVMMKKIMVKTMTITRMTLTIRRWHNDDTHYFRRIPLTSPPHICTHLHLLFHVMNILRGTLHLKF